MAANLREKTFLLVASYEEYEFFSNDRLNSPLAKDPSAKDPSAKDPSVKDLSTKEAPAKMYNSLEAVHNDMHGIIGGEGGHMNGIPYAAFDPIFWLHHT